MIKTGKQAELPKQNAGMYVGLAVLACVAVMVVGVLVRNRLKRKRMSNNNRRYETWGEWAECFFLVLYNRFVNLLIAMPKM